MKVKVKTSKRQQQPQLAIETCSIDEVHPHPQNVRLHDDANIASIIKSISEFGQRTPIVVNAKGEILKGNGTFEAMSRMGVASIQIVRVTHLTPEQEIAYSIADNRTSDLSTFDLRGLTRLIQSLFDAGYDVAATGFTEFETAPLFSPEDTPPEEKETSVQIRFTSEQIQVIHNVKRRMGSAAEDMAEFLVNMCKRLAVTKKGMRT